MPNYKIMLIVGGWEAGGTGPEVSVELYYNTVGLRAASGVGGERLLLLLLLLLLQWRGQ